MYGEVKSPTLQDKIAKGIAIYGAGILGLAVIVNYIFKAFSINFSHSVTVLGLFIFLDSIKYWYNRHDCIYGVSFLFRRLLQWKYPEEYRESGKENQWKNGMEKYLKNTRSY